MPTQPARVERAPTWATVRHGTVTQNQRAVLRSLDGEHEATAALSAGRVRRARATLVARGLVARDADGRYVLTSAGDEIVRSFRY